MGVSNGLSGRVILGNNSYMIMTTISCLAGRGSGVNLTAADEVRLEKLSDSSPSAADNLLKTNASLVQDSPKPSTTYHRVSSSSSVHV